MWLSWRRLSLARRRVRGLSYSITKLLGVARNFKEKLGSEEADIVRLLTNLMARKERRMAVKEGAGA